MATKIKTYYMGTYVNSNGKVATYCFDKREDIPSNHRVIVAMRDTNKKNAMSRYKGLRTIHGPTIHELHS